MDDMDFDAIKEKYKKIKDMNFNISLDKKDSHIVKAIRESEIAEFMSTLNIFVNDIKSSLDNDLNTKLMINEAKTRTFFDLMRLFRSNANLLA